MRPPIYQPKGAAREYGKWALNVYDGCPHGCPYCYVPLVLHKDRKTFHANVSPRPGIVEETRKQLERTGMTGETIFLCFSCDPYPTGYDSSTTREIIQMLKAHGNHVCILTKGNGSRDFDLLDSDDWYGVTFDGSEAGTPAATMRISTIIKAERRGIKTWASYEPVLNPAAVLDYIEIFGRIFDRVKIGRLNHMKLPQPVHWGQFGRDAEALCQRLGLDYYIKDSLRREMEKR